MEKNNGCMELITRQYSIQGTNLGKNLVGVQVNAFGWEALKHIPLDQEGQHAYRMEPALNGVYHRLIVDIKLEDHIKRVTFRSGLMLLNRTKHRIQFALANCKRQITSTIYSTGMSINYTNTPKYQAY